MDSRHVIVITKNYGQLGNRLLLTAHLIAAAREHGVRLWNPSFDSYAKYFPSTQSDLWCRYPATDDSEVDAPSPWMRELVYRSCYLPSRMLSHLRLTRFPAHVIRLTGEDACDVAGVSFREKAQSRLPLLVSGWRFRSIPLLKKHAAAVRDHYRILPKHRQQVDNVVQQARASGDLLVGVHVRHGDYATYENGRYYYSVQQYADAMRRIERRLGAHNIRFLVCGNAELSKSDFRGLKVQFGTGHLIEDLYAFAETDLLIGPPSTFTQWASFYGQVPLEVMHTAELDFQFDSVQQISPFVSTVPAQKAA